MQCAAPNSSWAHPQLDAKACSQLVESAQELTQHWRGHIATQIGSHPRVDFKDDDLAILTYLRQGRKRSQPTNGWLEWPELMNGWPS